MEAERRSRVEKVGEPKRKGRSEELLTNQVLEKVVLDMCSLTQRVHEERMKLCLGRAEAG